MAQRPAATEACVPVASPWGPGAVARRLLWSLILTAAILLLAVAGLAVTTAPEWLSLALEPFSLLLTPGVFLAMLTPFEHDYTQFAVLAGNALFYGAISFALLSLRANRLSRASSRRTPSQA